MLSLEYIAGFFDGEGWITHSKLYKPNGGGLRPGWQLKVGIGNTNPAALVVIHKQFPGGYLVRKQSAMKNSRPGWDWGLHSGGAAAFLATILPFLILKRDEAMLAIKIREHTVEHRDKFRHFANATWEGELATIMAERSAMVAEVRAMKKRIHSV